jgi:hypothetical protein
VIAKRDAKRLARRGARRGSKAAAERAAASPGPFDHAAARATGPAQEIGLVIAPEAEARQGRNHRIRRGDDLNVHLRLVVRHVHRIRLPQGRCFHRIPRHCHRTGRNRSSHTRYHNRFGRSFQMMPANHGVFWFSMEALVGCDKGLAWGC